jgi:hypothetical protein
MTHATKSQTKSNSKQEHFKVKVSASASQDVKFDKTFCNPEGKIAHQCDL